MIDKNDPRLTAYLLDELDDDSAAEVQAAIDTSPELREHADALRRTIGTLQNALATSGDVVMSDGQLAEIDEAVSQGTVTKPVVSDDSDRRTLWRNLAFAALVLYAIGISISVSYTHLTLPTIYSV